MSRFAPGLVVIISILSAPTASHAGPGALLDWIPHPLSGIKAFDTGFGRRLAVVNTDILVAARKTHLFEGNEIITPFNGTTYLFDGVRGSFGSLKFEIPNPDRNNRGSFGAGVAALKDTLAVGTRTSTVYGFDREDGDLKFTVPLPSKSRSTFDVPITTLGDDTFIAAAPSKSVNGSASAGAVYGIDATTGEVIVRIPHPTAQRNGALGLHKGLATTEDRIIAGSILDDPDGPTIVNGSVVQPGAAFVFDAANGDLLFRLENPEPHSQDLLPTPDLFGVAVAATEEKIFVGAHKQDAPGVQNAGVVHAYDFSTGDFLFTIPNPDPDPTDDFGNRLGIVNGHLMVSAQFDEVDGVPDVGTAYLFDPDTGDLVLEIPGPKEARQFGDSFAELSGNILIGAPTTFIDGMRTGAVYLTAGLHNAPEPGNTTGVGDVGVKDATTVVLNWTGALGPGEGLKFWRDGDFDGDRDVDAVDLTTVILAWRGAHRFAEPIVVPEPTGFPLLTVFLLMAARTCNRRIR